MNGLQVFLFGKASVRCGEQYLSGFHAQRAQELLGYLLLYRGHPLSRETLAGVLWEDRAPTQSKKSLRQALWQLRATLDAASESCRAPVLLVEPDWIQVNPDVGLWLDVAEFEQAFRLVQGVPAHELDAQKAQRLQDAAQLYQGDLLEGCYQHWCMYERERLQNMYLTMLNRLMRYFETHHEYQAGLDYGARLLRYDPACERAHRGLMRLHYLNGDRTASLRQYERCVAALAEVLGTKPDKRTLALYEQIRGDPVSSQTPTPAEAAPVTEAVTAPLPVALAHLRQMGTALADLQRQVQEAIQAIERALTDHR